MAKMQVTDNTEKSKANALHIKQEQKALGNMTVKEKLLHYNLKAKQGTITPEEEEIRKQLQDEVENNGKSVDVGRNKSLQKKGRREVEDKKFIKEQDILDYLYNEWLIAGANWLLNKTYKLTIYTGDKLVDIIQKSIQDRHHKTSDSTTNYADNIDSEWESYHKKTSADTNTKSGNFKEKIERFNRCEGTDEEKNTLLYQILEESSPKKRAECCNNLLDMSDNLHNNVKAVQYMASSLARAQMIQNAMDKENPGLTNPGEFEEMCRRNSYLIAKRIDNAQENGEDPSKIMEELYKNITKANETVNKSLKKGKYKGNPKKSKDPISNDALLDVNASLGLNNDGSLDPNTNIHPTPGRQNLLYAALEYQGIDGIIQAHDQQLRNSVFANMSAQQANDERKARFQYRLEQMKQGGTILPEKLQKKTKDNDNTIRVPLQPFDRGSR